MSIEYKSGLLFEKPDKAANDICIDVSAFANAAGGTIIYGVKEENHVPVDIDGVNPKAISPEWIDQVMSSRIHPKIGGVLIRVIRIPGSLKAIYLAWVPQSDRAPHQAHDKRFYIRRNARTEPMEEYEIMDVWQRKKAPDIVLDFYFRRQSQHIDKFPVSWANPATEHQVELNADIWNEGGGQVHRALIEITLDSRLVWPRPAGYDFPMKELTFLVGRRTVPVHFLQMPWSGPSGMPLFKPVRYRLFRRDFPIRFMKDWVEGDTPPFLLWSIRAPDMFEKVGYVTVIREGESLALSPKPPPRIGGYQRDVFQAPFMATPDISFGPCESETV